MHRTMTREEVLAALFLSGLREADTAGHLLREDEFEVSSHVSTCDTLLDTYQLRLNHIRTQSGAHALRLAEATSELVENLKCNGEQPGRWVVIKGVQESKFLVWRLEQGQLLGCLPVVSQLDVSSDRWKELWGQDA